MPKEGGTRLQDFCRRGRSDVLSKSRKKVTSQLFVQPMCIARLKRGPQVAGMLQAKPGRSDKKEQ